MATAGRYERMPSNGLSGRVSFHYSALGVYWIPWGTLVVEWVKAQILKKAGDLSALRQFVQKRLAEVWKQENDAPPVELRGADYLKADLIDGQRIEGEVRRFLTIDRQQDQHKHLRRRTSRSCRRTIRLRVEGTRASQERATCLR